MDNLCRFSLIFPPWPWLPWALVIAGVLIAWLAIRRMLNSPGTGMTMEISLKDLAIKLGGAIISVVIPLLLGLGLVVVGLTMGVSNYHQPFARWLGDKFPSLIADADKIMKGDYHNEPLRSIAEQANSAGQYSVRLTQKAKDVGISGDYEEALCGPDLIAQICKREGGKIFCDIDSGEKVVRICMKGDEAACRDRTL